MTASPTPPDTDTVFRATDLALGYGATPVIHGLSAQIQHAEIVALIGPNGAGKTTLLRALAGDLAPHSGGLTFRGQAITTMNRRLRAQAIAYVPPTLDLLSAMAVTEFVGLGRTPYLLGGRRWQATDQSAVAYGLRVMDLEAFADRNIHELSEGEKHRAMIALALAQEPDVLLLDEPTAHLDIKHAWQTMELVSELHRTRGMTIVLTTHDLNLAAEFADRLFLLADNRLHAAGPASEVLVARTLSAVYGYPIQVWTDPDQKVRRVFPLRR